MNPQNPTSGKPGLWRALVLAARPKTLSSGLIPVVLAAALAWRDGVFCAPAVGLCVAFALLMQVDANYINDLFDFLKGSDGAERLGPERACAQGWLTPRQMRAAVAVVTVAACAVGCGLFLFAPWQELLLLGVGCVALAFLYTLLLSYFGLGDVLVVLGFGLAPVCGTYYVQAQSLTGDALLLGVLTGLLTDTMLVINNYRDRDTDRRDGKHTLIAILGEPFGRWLYLLLGIAAWALALVLLHGANGLTPETGGLAVLPTLYLPLHFTTWLQMVRIRQGRALNAILGLTSRNMLAFALLLAAALSLMA